jgi:hypothetical protein
MGSVEEDEVPHNGLRVKVYSTGDVGVGKTVRTSTFNPGHARNFFDLNRSRAEIFSPILVIQ